MGTSCDLRVESLADHPELLEQVGLLRWKEWAYETQDPGSFIEVTAMEAGRSGPSCLRRRRHAYLASFGS